MKIAVNTRLLLPNKLDGIGWFTYESLKRITASYPEHQFYFIFDRTPSEEFIFNSNVTPVVTHPQSRHPILWYLFFEWGVPRVLNKIKPDIFLSPDGWLSLNTQIASLPVIHDLSFIHYPEFIPWSISKYYNYYFPKFAKKASRIATVSEYSKLDISNQYNINSNKIDVVYNGSNESYKPLSSNIQDDIRNKYTNGSKYFLFIGTIHPRKNLVNLMLAFDKFKNSDNDGIKLIIVGAKKWVSKKDEQLFDSLKHKSDIIFFGRASESELKEIIPSALALTYPSVFEGFGIPIVEAFYSGVPVITANNSSMPEVGGNAAIYVDASSVNSITDALLKIAKDNEFAKSLIEKGHIQKLNFSWDKTAANLWNSVTSVIDDK